MNSYLLHFFLGASAEQIPHESITAAVIAIVATAFGYVGKNVYEFVKQERLESRARLASLHHLDSLLRSQFALYKTQLSLREKLFEQLLRKKRITGIDQGLEDAFSKAYSSFDPEDLELHRIIRGLTTFGLARVNTGMSVWLEKDTEFKTAAVECSLRDVLAAQLRTLEVHLIMWNAKYNDWIPECPNHALVYLHDEKEHGIGFPTGIEDTIEQTLEELTSKYINSWPNMSTSGRYS
jgi:hypothetical protein